MQYKKHVKTRPASSISDAEMQALCDYIENIPNEAVLHTLYTTIANNSGGVQNMDPKMALAFARSFGKFKKDLPESKRREENKMKLTESQVRRAIRKWLFEFATDSGVSHRASTDDKIAGKLGDDRKDQPSSTIPQATPIVAVSQMSTQLTHDMPNIEDPDFIPGTVEELGRSVDMLSRQVPHDQIEWFYDKMQELADEAIEKGSKSHLAKMGGDDEEENDLRKIRPLQRGSDQSAAATNETWRRWSRMLSRTLNEAGKGTKNDPLNLRRRELSPQDMKLYREEEDDQWGDLDGDGEISQGEFATAVNRAPSGMAGEVVGGEYVPTMEEMEEMADDLGMELDELPGFDPRRHQRVSPEERQAQLASGQFDGDAKLRELVAMNIYPNVRTLSGMKKKIAAEIDPIVQMYATARPAFDWLIGFYQDEYQLDWNGQEISGPDIYQMAIDSYEKFNRKNQAKLDQLADAIESGSFYTEAMAEIVMAPILRKWVAGVADGSIDVSSSRARNNFVMSDWILETVLNSGFGNSGAKRQAAKLDSAMGNMQEFKAAMANVLSNNEPLGGI